MIHWENLTIIPNGIFTTQNPSWGIIIIIIIIIMIIMR